MIAIETRLYVKIIVVTYYWPPAGGVAVQRWLKFVRYLVQMGHDVVVFTADHASYPMLDHDLSSQVPPELEVHRVRGIEPRNIYKRIFRSEKKQAGRQQDNLDRLFFIPEDRRTLKEKFILWVRANLFVPDARVLWVKPAVRQIEKYLDQHEADFVITTGPPHSVHLIGREIRRKRSVRWVADFRDPWLDIEFYDHMPLTRRSDRKHRSLEKSVIEEADGVVVVANYWKSSFEKYLQKNIKVITNGYDTSDFPDARPELSAEFLISHVGTLQADRDAPELWRVLGRLCTQDEQFRESLQIQVLGNIDDGVVGNIVSNGLENNLIVRGFVSHRDAVSEMRRSQVLLLLINRNLRNAPGRMTSKIFEYIAAKRPVLLLGLKDSDPAELLRVTNSGDSVDFGDEQNLESVIRRYYSEYREGRLGVESVGIQDYSRRSLANQLMDFLSEIMENKQHD